MHRCMKECGNAFSGCWWSAIVRVIYACLMLMHNQISAGCRCTGCRFSHQSCTVYTAGQVAFAAAAV